MAIWEDVICKAKEWVDVASSKATDVADLAKHKIKIAENERSIRVTLEALGGILYESRKDGDIVMLDNGAGIYTVYYQKAEGDSFCSLMCTKWKLTE